MTITGRNKAEAYLRRIREMDWNLKRKRDELDALRYKASGAGAIRYDKDHVQTSPQDFLSMAMDDIIKLEKQIDRDETTNEQEKGEAYAIIRQMKNVDHRLVLEWYYLNGLSMVDTAEKVHMSERKTYDVREEALEGFAQIFLDL